jgi:hypothetical protein
MANSLAGRAMVAAKHRQGNRPISISGMPKVQIFAGYLKEMRCRDADGE